MWELDCEESWVPKNWCFWTVVLEKTLESLLDCKEIQPVHPKGDQSWVFIGRTDVEAETGSTSGLPVHHQLPELPQTHGHWVGDAIHPSHPLSSPSPPTFSLSQYQGLLKNESVLRIRWPKYWNFIFSISPSNEYSELISFRMDWLDLLAVQGTLKSLLKYYSSKASILRHSAFFTVQLSHPYMSTGKTIALTRRTLLAK